MLKFIKRNMKDHLAITKEYIGSKVMEQKEHVAGCVRLLRAEINGINKDTQKVFSEFRKMFVSLNDNIENAKNNIKTFGKRKPQIKPTP